MWNADCCDIAEDNIFESFKDFKLWLEEEKGKSFKEIQGFSSPPVMIIDDRGDTFLRLFRVADRYESGEIHYCRR